MGINLAYHDHFIGNLIRFIPLDYGISIIDIISFKRPEFIFRPLFLFHALFLMLRLYSFNNFLTLDLCVRLTFALVKTTNIKNVQF